MDTHMDAESESIMGKLPTGTDEQIIITDVNQFCLEHILMYLDFEDLLSVADANKYLKLATIKPFAQKYGWKLIHLRHIIRGKYKAQNEIKIQDLKIIFQLLRCFGQSISKLKIHYLEYHVYNISYDKNYHRIMDYVNEFCTESLTNVEIYPIVGFEHFKRPFVNVVELIAFGEKMFE